MSRWTALLLAGQRPGVDPLAAHFGQQWKALVEVGGEPMLVRVARTLLASPEIGRIVILAQEPEALLATPGTRWLEAERRVTLLPSQASISHSVAVAAGSLAAPWPVLVTTADHPLLTPEMVASFLAGVGDADLAAGLVERRTLLDAYPDNRRTWLPFRGGAYSGANLFALTGAAAQNALDLWATVERDRKKGWKLFAAFGPWLLVRTLLRTFTVEAAFAAAGERLGLSARAIVLPQAEAAIDVDKPADHALAETILSKR
ncbi:MAG: NTP transferase domain-containing protein [Alphaproteobacteria bacterium]|nr:NTP transferase domain-containing protein [Alphaproteobacteria bacterium]